MDLKNEHEDLVHTYLGLIRSYTHGFVRFASARIAALSLQNTVLSYRARSRVDFSESPYADVLSRVDQISQREFESFEYIYDLSCLVYLTSLFDTFLSDTTKFLLLLHPRSIGANQAVSLEAVLSAKSTYDLLNDVANKKAREISYLPFSGRLDFLTQHFGLRITLDGETLAQLHHYSTLRNAAVHDQAVFDCLLNAEGRLTLQQKACPLHPTPVNATDVTAAETAYRNVIKATCRAVIEQVLKSPDHPGFKANHWLFEDSTAQVSTIDSGGAV